MHKVWAGGRVGALGCHIVRNVQDIDSHPKQLITTEVAQLLQTRLLLHHHRKLPPETQLSSKCCQCQASSALWSMATALKAYKHSCNKANNSSTTQAAATSSS